MRALPAQTLELLIWGDRCHRNNMLSGWPGYWADPTRAKALSAFNYNYKEWTEAQF